MAHRSGWLKAVADYFKKDIPREVQFPQRYLELARKCMEHAKKMTSPSASSKTVLQFNKEQCAHLARELEEAVETADACSILFGNSTSQTTGLADSTTTTTTLGIMKLLCQCAKEVETFIQSCRHKNWIQSSMTLWNVAAHVSSLTFDLKFCTLLLRKNAAPQATMLWSELVELDAIDDKSKNVNEMVKRDQEALLLRLEALNQPSDDSEHCQLIQASDDSEHCLTVKYLSRRLKQVLSREVEPQAWEIDFSSLKQDLGTNAVLLGTSLTSRVLKSTWLGAEVAEKRFCGTDNPSFRNEVGILAGLTHPCILPLLGYATDEREDRKKSSIVTELMDGDLLTLMEQRQSRQTSNPFPFTTCEAVDMMLQTGEGMRYLHDNRVVHKDLKSQNILVKTRTNADDTEYIRLKVADFGLSKTKERSVSSSGHTPNTGTRRWMAPELLRTQGESGNLDNGTQLRYLFKVDVYSFGLVCYEILTGDIPFSSIGSWEEIKNTVLNGGRPKLPDACLPDLKNLISLCWEQDPQKRPSFVEICKRLRRVKYLLMRGSRVTIDALRMEHEEMKERERLREEQEEREAMVHEKEREGREAMARRFERERREEQEEREAMVHEKEREGRQAMERRFERERREATAGRRGSQPGGRAFTIPTLAHRMGDLGVGSASQAAWRTWPSGVILGRRGQHKRSKKVARDQAKL